MTIIIGIKTLNGIIIASDSQTTRDNTKRTDAQKIKVIQFSNGRALVGQAGNSGTGNRAIEILSETARDKPIADYRTVAELAWKAMLKVKNELREQNGGCDMEQLRDMIWKNEWQSSLMIGHYYKGAPYLYVVDLASGRSDKETSHCSAIGTGANLASYLLSEHTEPGMNSIFASAMAVFVVETVIRNDPYCSGPINMGIVTDEHNILTLEREGEVVSESEQLSWRTMMKAQGYVYDDIRIVPRDEMEAMAKIVMQIDRDTKSKRNQDLHSQIREVVKLQARKSWDAGVEFARSKIPPPPPLP